MDDMKAAFEKWFKSKHEGQMITKGSEYSEPITQLMWSAWQASRAAIVIELPEPFDFDHSKALVYDMDETIEAISYYGIKVKGKTE